MALISGIAFGDIHQRGISSGGGRDAGYLLPDQDYYNLRLRPEEEAAYAQAEGVGRQLQRGARAKQGQFLRAQGIGGLLGQGVQGAMTPSFARAMRRSRQATQMELEQKRRAAFAERDRKRAEEHQKLQSVVGIESALASLIPFAGPYISGATQAAGAQFGLGLRETPRLIAEARGYDDTLDLYDPEAGDGGYGDLPTRTRGGGGQDLWG